MTEPLQVPGLPFPLQPSPDSLWQVDGDGVRVTAAPHSDIFIDPGVGGGETLLNAVTLLGLPPDDEFTLSARVTVGFEAMFDAGALIVWNDERHWAKLCFEFSPASDAMAVSVVCNGVADDANSFVVDHDHLWLRIARKNGAWAFHASHRGRMWEFVRVFRLGADEPGSPTFVGFEAQSPTGEGVAVRFDQVEYTHRRLENLRDGT